MINDYVKEILIKIANTSYKKIMVYEYKLGNADHQGIENFAIEYNKEIIFATFKDIFFNNNFDILIIK